MVEPSRTVLAAVLPPDCRSADAPMVLSLSRTPPPSRMGQPPIHNIRAAHAPDPKMQVRRPTPLKFENPMGARAPLRQPPTETPAQLAPVPRVRKIAHGQSRRVTVRRQLRVVDGLEVVAVRSRRARAPAYDRPPRSAPHTRLAIHKVARRRPPLLALAQFRAESWVGVGLLQSPHPTRPQRLRTWPLPRNLPETHLPKETPRLCQNDKRPTSAGRLKAVG